MKGHGRMSVLLPPYVDHAGRRAVPVAVNDASGVTRVRIPADGRYHDVPAGHLVLRAVLPAGEAFEASTALADRGQARMTLSPLAPPRRPSSRSEIERRRGLVRFYTQASLDNYKRRPERSWSRKVSVVANQFALRAVDQDAGVVFLQLVEKAAAPLNIAFGEHTGVALTALEHRTAADAVLAEGRAQLALEYLEAGRERDARWTVELCGLEGRDVSRLRDPLSVAAALHVWLASGATKVVRAVAAETAARHPRVPDLVVLEAEALARLGNDALAARKLAELNDLGLPVLQRSYKLANLRLARSAAGERDHATHAVAERLRALTPYVDPASTLLAVRGTRPDRPRSGIGPARRALLAAAWHTYSYTVDIGSQLLSTRKEMAMTDPALAAANSPTANAPDAANGDAVAVDRRTNLGAVAVVAALAALMLAAAALVTKISSFTDEDWDRIVWIVTLTTGLLVATGVVALTVVLLRTQLQQAQAEAQANLRDAEQGRALAAALLAEDPAVVVESELSGQAAEIAGRHARLARSLFGNPGTPFR